MNKTNILNNRSIPFLIILLLSIAILIATHYSTGYFSVDDSGYHFMVKSFCEKGRLYVENGYEAFPSKELSLGVHKLETMVIKDNKLFPKIPFLYTIIAAPFYLLLNIHGLILLNIISYIFILYTIYKITLLLFENKRIAFISIHLFFLGTFVFEYAIGIWPHVINLLLIMISCYISLLLIKMGKNKKSFLLSFILGFILFFNFGIRMDSILTIIVIFSLILIFDDFPFYKVSSILMGGILPVTAMCFINKLRFGSFDVMSYTNKAVPNVVLFIGLVAAISLLLIVRSLKNKIHFNRKSIYFFLCISLVLILPFYKDILRIAKGTYILLFDLRIMPYIKSLHRDFFGGVTRAAILKKALFQSCPHMAVSIAAGILILKESINKKLNIKHTFLLIAMPIIYLLYFGYYKWIGGLCFNLRYYIPALPFLTILSAWYLDRLLNSAKKADILHSKGHTFWNKIILKLSGKLGLLNLRIPTILFTLCGITLIVLIWQKSLNIFFMKGQSNILLQLSIFILGLILLLIFYMICTKSFTTKALKTKTVFSTYISFSIILFFLYNNYIFSRLKTSLLVEHIAILIVPTILAMMLLIASLLSIFNFKNLRGIVIYLFIISLAFSQSITYLYDLKTSTARKKYDKQFSSDLNEIFLDKSIIFSNFIEAVYGLVHYKEDIYFATPGRDAFIDFHPLVDHFLSQNRNVYFIVDVTWQSELIKSTTDAYDINNIGYIDSYKKYRTKRFQVYQILRGHNNF